MVEFRVSSLSYEEQLALYLEAEQLFQRRCYAEAEPVLAAFARELPCFEHGMVWYQLADILNGKASLKMRTKLTLARLTANGTRSTQSAMAPSCGEWGAEVLP
jgi:hypothetical protein